MKQGTVSRGGELVVRGSLFVVREARERIVHGERDGAWVVGRQGFVASRGQMSDGRCRMASSGGLGTPLRISFFCCLRSGFRTCSRRVRNLSCTFPLISFAYSRTSSCSGAGWQRQDARCKISDGG